MSDDASGAPRSVADAARNVSGPVSAIGTVLPTSDQFMLWLGVTFVLITPITVGLITSNSTIAWVAAVCGAFVTLISRFASLTELSFGPIKATMRVVAQETLVVKESLDASQNTMAAVQAVAKALPDGPSKDFITTTSNAAMEALTAAIKANNVITLTTSTAAPYIVTSGALYPGGALGMAAPRGAGHSKPQQEK